MAIPVQTGGWGRRLPTGESLAAFCEGKPRGATKSRLGGSGASSPANFGQLIYSDYRRYRAAGARGALAVVAMTQGFWASVVYRLTHWALCHAPIPGLRRVVKAGCVLLQKTIEVLTGISLPGQCQVGLGLYIGHFGGIFIDSQCRLGSNCNLSQGVTIGQGGRGELHGVPVLGDRVHVGAHAVILGKISIGDDAVIGPGAVVLSSVPPRGVAMGNPARVVGLTGSFEFVNYDGMQTDPARVLAIESLAEHTAPGGKEGETWNECSS